MDRRTFITTLAAGIAMAADIQAQGTRRGRRRAGLIGCGWYGGVDLLRLSQVEPIEVVALCDVDKKALEATLALVAGFQGSVPKTFSDYRDMFARHEFDIVIVATPDHWHALPAIAAIEAGAHVYLEKPVGVDVSEGHAIADAARENERVVQVNLQRRSMPHVINVRDNIIGAGKLGNIALAEGYCYWHMRPTGNPADSAPPDSLFYEMWNGPAPLMPYNSMFHPQGWRGFTEFSNGIIGDMGVHMLDTVRFLLGLDWPKSIRSEGGILVDKESKANTTDTQVATFDYNDLKVTWQHRSWGLSPRPEEDWTKQWGVTLYGENGSLRLTSVDYEFTPAGEGETIRGNAVTEDIDATNSDYDAIDRAAAVAERAHQRNFLEAIDRGKDPASSIEEGQISSASCILANMAMKLERSLTYNGLSRTVRGDREANELLARPYRSPWKHPADRRK